MMTEDESNGHKNILLLIVGVAIILAGIIVFGDKMYREWCLLNLDNLDLAKMGTKLTGFLIFALFIERLAEVYIIMRYGEARAELRSKIDQFNRSVQQKKEIAEMILRSPAGLSEQIQKLNVIPDKDVSEDTYNDLGKSKKTAHKLHQRTALIVSLSAGLLLTLSGLRVVESIFGELPNPDDAFQHELLVFLDVLLTTAIISGGAEALHPIMKAISGAQTPDPTKPVGA